MKKKDNMAEILGLNWYTLFGIILLLISLILIIYGLNNNINSKSLFNVSRLLALLSVAGIWYFGNINTKNTSLEIEQSKKESAQAITKTKELELDVITAKRETGEAKLKTEEIKLEVEKANESAEKARLKTEEIKLEVEKANAKAEKAKLEREKLKQQTLILEKQNAELKIESDRIKSFVIKINLVIKDDGTFSRYGNHDFFGVVGRAGLIKGKNEILHEFLAKQVYQIQKTNDNRIWMSFDFNPINPDNTYTKSIKSLESVDLLALELGETIKRHKITPTELISIEAIIIINEVQTITIKQNESKFGLIMNNKTPIITVNKEFSKIVELYKSKTK